MDASDSKLKPMTQSDSFPRAARGCRRSSSLRESESEHLKGDFFDTIVRCLREELPASARRNSSLVTCTSAVESALLAMPLEHCPSLERTSDRRSNAVAAASFMDTILKAQGASESRTSEEKSEEKRRVSGDPTEEANNHCGTKARGSAYAASSRASQCRSTLDMSAVIRR